MKKFLGLIVFMGLLLSVIVPSVSEAKTSFKDVSSNQRFYDEISYLINDGVISGFKDGTFGPDRVVTRAQAAIMIGRALDLDGAQRSTHFKDVDSTQVASGYIASAVKEGIISGYPDKTYRPDQPVTRGQMAIFLDRAFTFSKGQSNAFTDVSKNMQAYQSILNVAAKGITSGYPDGTYRPDQAVTRGQFSAFLARAIEPSFRGLPPTPKPVQWAGKWTNQYGTLTISNEKSNTFDFTIGVSMGGHVGDIEGTATVKGNSAVYTEYIDLFEGLYNDPTCRVSFTKSGDSINVKETAACSYWHGMAASFDGNYSKSASDAVVKNSRFTTEMTDEKSNKYKVYFLGKNDKRWVAGPDDTWAAISEGDVLYEGDFQIGLQQQGSTQVEIQPMTIKDYQYNQTREMVFNVPSKSLGQPDFLLVSSREASIVSSAKVYYIKDGVLKEAKVKGENGDIYNGIGYSNRPKTIGNNVIQLTDYYNADPFGWEFATYQFHPSNGLFTYKGSKFYLDDNWEKGRKEVDKWVADPNYKINETNERHFDYFGF